MSCRLVNNYVQTTTIKRAKHNLFIKIRNQLHVSAILRYPQANYNIIYKQYTNAYVILLKKIVLICVTCAVPVHYIATFVEMQLHHPVRPAYT